MTTRDTIIQVADHLIRYKGFNAFSFKDISIAIGIKTASIHYHFPTKTDLGIATIKRHIERLEALKAELENKSPLTLSPSSKALCATQQDNDTGKNAIKVENDGETSKSRSKTFLNFDSLPPLSRRSEEIYTRLLKVRAAILAQLAKMIPTATPNRGTVKNAVIAVTIPAPTR